MPRADSWGAASQLRSRRVRCLEWQKLPRSVVCATHLERSLRLAVIANAYSAEHG
jgi:hypothetical protein